MNECVTIDLEDKDQVNIPVSLIRNTLDYVRVKIIKPSSSDALLNNYHDPIPVCLRATMTASSLNQALTVHEKGLHSSFYLDHRLSQSGKAINMPAIQQLDLDCPICLQCQLTKSIPDPGGSIKTKNSTTVGRNDIQTSHDIKHADHINRLAHQL